VYLYLVTVVSRKPIVPIFKGQAVQEECKREIHSYGMLRCIEW